MTIDTEDLLNSILASLDRTKHIKPEDIPGIELYMDQVTTFMESRLKSTSRFPGEDKILTKTMINNYAKNDLLPPPVKKKYTKEHMLLLIFIYYFKGVLSINDIQSLLGPITEKFFGNNKEFGLEDVYREVFTMSKEEMEALKADVVEKYKASEKSYENAPEEEREYLKRFAFICSLSFDVYVKKLIIEKMLDGMNQPKNTDKDKKKKTEK